MDCKSLNSIAVLFLFQANCDSLVPLCIDQIVKGNVMLSLVFGQDNCTCGWTPYVPYVHYNLQATMFLQHVSIAVRSIYIHYMKYNERFSPCMEMVWRGVYSRGSAVLWWCIESNRNHMTSNTNKRFIEPLVHTFDVLNSISTLFIYLMM